MNKKRNIKLKKIYNYAYNFLIEIYPKEIKDLNKYLTVEKNFKNKNDILYRLLISLQNRQRFSNTIGFENEERKEIFNKILYNYDSKKILDNYNCDSLFKTFNKHFKIKNQKSKNNSWKLYSKAVISACKFIDKFKDAKEFDEFVKSFTNNPLTTDALPMLLEKEIIGLGFPLACDFLKELGFCNYPKPDVHIKDIFTAFKLCDFELCKNKDYEIFKAVKEMANAVDETPYKIDKILWLICSGNFYLDGINIGRNKQEFISKGLKEIK